MGNIGEMKKVRPETLQLFNQHKQDIIRKVVNISLQRQEEVTHHGIKAKQVITSGINFTTKMLESAIMTEDVSLLHDQIIWAMDRLPHDGVRPEFILNRFNIYADVVNEILPEDNSFEINQYIYWMQSKLKELIKEQK